MQIIIKTEYGTKICFTDYTDTIIMHITDTFVDNEEIIKSYEIGRYELIRVLRALL